MFSKRNKPATQSEKRRWRTIKEEVGCTCCRLEGNGYCPPDIHHLLDGYRRGHGFTIGLCEWHHRGNPPMGRTIAEATDLYGPSLAHNPRKFSVKYGSDDELLLCTDEMILKMDQLWGRKQL